MNTSAPVSFFLNGVASQYEYVYVCKAPVQNLPEAESLVMKPERNQNDMAIQLISF